MEGYICRVPTSLYLHPIVQLSQKYHEKEKNLWRCHAYEINTICRRAPINPIEQHQCPWTQTVSISKNVHKLKLSTLTPKKNLPRHAPCVVLTLRKTHLYPPWKLHSGTSKDEIQCQFGSCCTHGCIRIVVLGRLLNMLLLDPSVYACPPSPNPLHQH